LATSGASEAGAPLIIEGYLLDADDTYIYMADDSLDNIRQAVKNDFVVYVHVIEKESEADQLFSSLPKTKKRDMN